MVAEAAQGLAEQQPEQHRPGAAGADDAAEGTQDGTRAAPAARHGAEPGQNGPP